MTSLYTFSRRLFWRRRQPKLNKLRQHFFFDLLRELPNCTSYNIELQTPPQRCALHNASLPGISEIPSPGRDLLAHAQV
jgi:hypothetical protein